MQDSTVPLVSSLQSVSLLLNNAADVVYWGIHTQ